MMAGRGLLLHEWPYRVIAIVLFSLLSVATPASAQNTFPAGGNVGIGTTSPGEKLTVIGGGTTSYIQMHLEPAQTPGVANAGGFELWARSAAGTYQKWEFQAVPSDSVPSGGLIIYDRTANAYRLVIANGNVGIGTTSPAAALHVAGSTRIDGDAQVNGNIAAKYQDVAEWVRTASAVSGGTVVGIDTHGTNRGVASSKAYDTGVAGVSSLQPGIVLGDPG